MRLQLALDVENLDDAVAFYDRLFGTTPAKRKPGYANYEIADPPLKLVLFENPGAGGGINHLGVETETPDEVVAAHRRLAAAGLAVTDVDETVCCYADKVECWTASPEGQRWEWYVKTGDSDTFDGTPHPRSGSGIARSTVDEGARTEGVGRAGSGACCGPDVCCA